MKSLTTHTTKPIMALLVLSILGCGPRGGNLKKDKVPAEVHVVGSMTDMFGKGNLAGRIDLDTISDKKGLYGIGPISHLRGELLIIDGQCHAATVTRRTRIKIEKRCDVSAPFFVYSHVEAWDTLTIPKAMKDIETLEGILSEIAGENSEPFAFRLHGKVPVASIHVQDLPLGQQAKSHTEAMSHQFRYSIKDVQGEVVGFYSRDHKGVFTHHDSFVHMHLITSDGKVMGHIDALTMEEPELYVPKGLLE